MAGAPFLNLETLPCEEDLKEQLVLFDEWLVYEKHYSPHTRRGYLSELRYFLTFLPDHLGSSVNLKHLAALKVRDFRSYLTHRATKQNNQNTTRARALASLRTFFRWLDKTGVLHNPQIKLLRSPKKHHTLPKAVEYPHIMTLLDELDLDAGANWISCRDIALITLLYGAGIRISEALALDYKSKPQKEQTELLVMGKRQKERYVPLLPIVTQAIDTYVETCPFPFEDDTPLFLGVKGKRLSADVARRSLRNLRRQLQLPETITPHAFRHSFATHLLNRGVNLRIIQEVLGHASLSSTQIYTDLNIDDLKRVYDDSHPRQKKPKE